MVADSPELVPISGIIGGHLSAGLLPW